jgi:hypothetical protein
MGCMGASSFLLAVKVVDKETRNLVEDAQGFKRGSRINEKSLGSLKSRYRISCVFPPGSK